MASVNNSLVGAVRAEATLESGKFVDGAKKIRVEAKKTEVQVKQSFGAMGSSIKGFGTALTAGLSIGLLGGLIKKSLDFATSIKDVAKQVGVTTTELQEFRYAASQVGIAEAAADKGLENLNKTLSKAASGSKTATAALAAVGVTLKDIQTKSRLEIFGQIADQMNKQGGAAKNAAAANAIFGEGAAKLVPLLDKGSQGVNELRDSVHRLGGVLSEDQIQRADETARKLDDVRRVLATQIAGVVADNANAITSLAGALGQLTGQILNFLNSNPEGALAIIGALLGGRFGGLPGAAVGAVAGYGIGVANSDYTKAAPHTRADVPFLRHNVAVTAADIRARRNKGLPIKQSELDRLNRMTAKLNAAAGITPSSGGFGGNLPQFLASTPKTSGGRKRTPRAPRDRSDDVTFQFDQELRRAQIDVLRAQQSLATTSDERARIALQLLDAERAMQEAELNDRVRRAERDLAEGKITAATLEQIKTQAGKLRAEYDSRDAIERKAIADQLAADKARDAATLADSAYDLRLEQLQSEASLAETASERRAAELRILALMKEQEKARLEAVIADRDSSDLAKQQARQRLGQLDAIYAGRTASVIQGTRGPMDDWLAQLPTTAAKTQEAFEQLQVQGFEGLIDAALALSDGFDSAKEALLNTLKQFFLGMARMQLQQLAGNLVGGGFKLPGFHTGGSMMLKGRPGIDKNIISMNGVPIARADYGERLRFEPANDRGGTRYGNGLTQNFTVYADDADSFRRSSGQIRRESRRRLGVQT